VARAWRWRIRGSLEADDPVYAWREKLLDALAFAKTTPECVARVERLSVTLYFVIPLAAWRRQSRHRQSSPSIGVGRRAGSSAHQQSPESAHENAVPQREQTI
jgi:hypothetical protein